MAIETTCGGCGKQLSVGDEHAGRRARCPACGQIYTIPSPNSAPPDLPTVPQVPAPQLPAPQVPVSQSPISDSFAETTAGFNLNPSIPSLPNSAQADAASIEQFWMRATDGTEYGPADRATLNRWFNEGRVGPGYMIRQSETGNWQTAEVFKPGQFQAGQFQAGQFQAGMPNIPTAANPYSNASGPTIPAYGQMYPKPDQSGLILAFGILSWFICPIFGIVAWVMGNSGLRDIKLGLVDPANKGLMQAGYYLGMVNVILYIICGGGYFVLIALMILGGTMS